MRFVVLLLLMVSRLALADSFCPAGQQPQDLTWSWSGSGGPWPDAQTACNAIGPMVTGPGFLSAAFDDSRNVCIISFDHSVNGVHYPPTSTSEYSISPHYSCVDAPPPPPSCDNNPPLACTTSGGSCDFEVTYASRPSSLPTQYCSGQCVYRVTGAAGAAFGGKYSLVLSVGAGTGASCSQGAGDGPIPSGSTASAPAPDPSASTPAPSGCPQGQVSGTVNGATVCVAGGDSSSNSSNTTKAADGSQSDSAQSVNCSGASCTTTTTNTVTAADGSRSVSVTQTTVNTQSGTGSSTTTVTRTDASGNASPPVTTSSAGSAAGACAADPKAKGCAAAGAAGAGAGGSGVDPSSAASVDCPAPDACSGDAIECAILVETHRARCADQKLFDDLAGSSSSVLGQAILSGADPSASSLPSAASSASVDVGQLDDSGWLGGGSCFSDKTVSVFGKAVTISFSQFCGPLASLKYFTLAIAGIVSLGIMRNAVLNG